MLHAFCAFGILPLACFGIAGAANVALASWLDGIVHVVVSVTYPCLLQQLLSPILWMQKLLTAGVSLMCAPVLILVLRQVLALVAPSLAAAATSRRRTPTSRWARKHCQAAHAVPYSQAANFLTCEEEHVGASSSHSTRALGSSSQGQTKAAG
jgi:hypothetical protein